MISFFKYNGCFKVKFIKRFLIVSPKCLLSKTYSHKNIKPFLCELLANRINLEVLDYPELSDKNQLFSVLSVSKKFKDIISKFENDSNFDGLSKKMSDEGFLSINIPKAYGGVDFNKMQFMQITENMFYNIPFTLSILIPQYLVSEALVASNSEFLRNKYLPKLKSGELNALYCMNEEIRKELVPKNFKTQATLSADGKYYRINGRKTNIINADTSKLLLVIANVESPNEPEISQPAAFIVDPYSDGLVFIPNSDNNFGLSGIKYNDIVFSNVSVPLENKLVDGSIATKMISKLVTMENAFISGMSLGFLKSVMNAYYDFLSTREVFGVPLVSYQRLKVDVMLISKDILLNESTTYYIAGILDKYPDADFILESAVTKTVCIEALSRWMEKYTILLGHSGGNKNLHWKAKCTFLQFHGISCLNTHLIAGHEFIQYILDDEEGVSDQFFINFLVKFGFLQDIKCTNIDGTKRLRLSNYIHPDFLYYLSRIFTLLRKLSIGLYSLKKEHGNLLLEDQFLKYELSVIMFDVWLLIVGSSKMSRTRCLFLPTTMHQTNLYHCNNRFSEIKLKSDINNLLKYCKETYGSTVKQPCNLFFDYPDKMFHPFDIQ